MRELFSLLERRQKRLLAWLAGLLAAALVFLLFVVLIAPRRLERRAGEVRILRRQFELADGERAKAGREVGRWEEARSDVDEIRRDRFYGEGKGVNDLRLDLQKIFTRSGRTFPEAKFDYTEMEKENARKVSITFNFEGSYGQFKTFLAEVERGERFLFVERIIFLNIDPDTGTLLLKMTLTAYYAI